MGEVTSLQSQILKYWYELEFFNPCWPVKLGVDTSLIHTFQGKEADEVLLVLGYDAQSGQGAARWVGQKPNIINVAVSRTKYRVGVVGDYDMWKNISYVQTVCKYLEWQ